MGPPIARTRHQFAGRGRVMGNEQVSKGGTYDPAKVPGLTTVTGKETGKETGKAK